MYFYHNQHTEIKIEKINDKYVVFFNNDEEIHIVTDSSKCLNIYICSGYVYT